MAKRALRVGLSLVLMVVLLLWFLHGADLGKMLQELRQAQASLLLVGTLLCLLSYWTRALRWQLILRPVSRVAHGNVVMATAIGYAGITLLPARLGDIIRPVLLARRERISVSATLASILTERVFDLWTVVVFFLLFLVWPPVMTEGAAGSEELRLLSLSAYVIGAAVIAGTLVLLGLIHYQQRFIDLATKPFSRLLPRWKGPVERFLGHFLDGLRVLHRPRDLVLTLLVSIVVWMAIYTQLRLTLLAFSIDLPLRACFFIVAASVLGLAIPTPGAVGGFHKAMELGLGFFMVAGSSQLVKSFVIVHWAICFVPITMIGLACLPVLGLTLSQARQLADQVESGAPVPDGAEQPEEAAR